VDAAEAKKKFKAYLSSQQLKYTRQRKAIADVFFDQNRHLSLTEIHTLARQQHPSTGFATVYRTMKLMAESGLASEHKFAEGQARYEPAGDHHDHLICVRCGKIVEFEDHEIEDIQDRLARQYGFKVVGHRHEIYGDCLTPDCPEQHREQETDVVALGLADLRSRD